MTRRRTRRRGPEAESGATDIAFLVLFLLMFALVNIKEGDPTAPRLMATAPIFDITDRSRRPVAEPESWVLVRMFEHGFDEVDTGARCRTLPPGSRTDRPGVVTVTRHTPGATGDERAVVLGAMHCTIDEGVFDRLRTGQSLYRADLQNLFGAVQLIAPMRTVVLEINRQVAFQFVVEAGEALQAARRPGQPPIRVRYRGYPAPKGT